MEEGEQRAVNMHYMFDKRKTKTEQVLRLVEQLDHLATELAAHVVGRALHEQHERRLVHELHEARTQLGREALRRLDRSAACPCSCRGLRRRFGSGGRRLDLCGGWRKRQEIAPDSVPELWRVGTH